ncbi:MAG: hypothetical protein ACYDHT_03420, partial [Solirubrobacteraceae bacterium]
IQEEEAVRSNRLDVCVPAIGASGCGPEPPEDEMRVAPRYRTPAGDPGEQQRGADTTSNAGQSTANGSAPATSQTLGASAHQAAAKAVIVSIGARRLVLRLSAAGSIAVKLARSVRSGKRRRWRTVTTIKANAVKAGTLTLKLPRLSLGRYRASITFAGAPALTETFLIRRTH